MAPITGTLARLVWGGGMPGGDEWSCSLHLAAGQGELSSPSILLPAYLPPLTDWMNRVTTHINVGASLQFIKLNNVNKTDLPGQPGTAGRYTDPSEANTLILNPQVAPMSGFPAPNQLTSCVTLHSALARGRGSKARFYPPTLTVATGPANMIGNDGRISVAAAKEMADSAQELLAEINNASAVLTAVVWSQIGQVAHPIERVSVGRVVDTQRRRRGSLDEDRQFALANV